MFGKTNLHKALFNSDFASLWPSFNNFFYMLPRCSKAANGVMEVRTLRDCISLARHFPAMVSATLTIPYTFAERHPYSLKVE